MTGRELVTWAEALPGCTMRVGLFKRYPLMLVGYDSGRVAVVYLAPDYRVLSAGKIQRCGTRPVEVASR